MATEPETADLGIFEPTGEVTEHVRAYRRGETTFDQLRDYLVHHTFTAPSRYSVHDADEAGSEAFDYFEVNTWGEVKLLKAVGLLTDDEYLRISQSADAHDIARGARPS